MFINVDDSPKPMLETLSKDAVKEEMPCVFCITLAEVAYRGQQATCELDWHHSNLRYGFTILKLWTWPSIESKSRESSLSSSLSKEEDIWLNGDK